MRIFKIIGKNPRHFDEIMVESGYNFGELTSILMSLESKGYIEEIGGNFYKR